MSRVFILCLLSFNCISVHRQQKAITPLVHRFPLLTKKKEPLYFNPILLTLTLTRTPLPFLLLRKKKTIPFLLSLPKKKEPFLPLTRTLFIPLLTPVPLTKKKRSGVKAVKG